MTWDLATDNKKTLIHFEERFYCQRHNVYRYQDDMARFSMMPLVLYKPRSWIQVYWDN